MYLDQILCMHVIYLCLINTPASLLFSTPQPKQSALVQYIFESEAPALVCKVPQGLSINERTHC